MQRMIPHMQPLPPCSAGHRARHMHDRRGLHCGGGHFIECACRQSQRFDSFGQALGNWRQINGIDHAAHRPRVVVMRAAGNTEGRAAS